MEINTTGTSGVYNQFRYTANYSKEEETESIRLPFEKKDKEENEADMTFQSKSVSVTECYYEMRETSRSTGADNYVGSTSKNGDVENDEIQTEPLGMGFVLTKGNMGYGMTASRVVDPNSDETVIRVNVAMGGGESKAYEVNLNEVDPRNATAVEMFAYCQYRDATGNGANSTFGSWNALKQMIDPIGGMEFNSLEEATTKKMNWDNALVKSNTSFTKMSTGETLSAADLLQMLREAYNKANEDDEGDKDWRTMSEEEWDKLINSVDAQLAALREAARADAEKAAETEEKKDLLDQSDLSTARSRSFHRSNSYTDPETGETVTTEHTDRAFITQSGVAGESSGYNSKTGESEQKTWEVPFEEEGIYERAIALLDQIPEEDNTFFAENERFWKDFAAGEIDEEEFLDYYNTLDHGKFRINTDENGNSTFDRDMMTSKYAGYFSVPLGKVYTLEEMQQMWDAQIQANQNKKLSTEQMMASDLTGTKGTYRFAGESRIYDFYDFLEEFERRYGRRKGNF